MTGIPRDPVMLFKLHQYPAERLLSQPRRALQRPFLDRETLDETLSSIDYFYDRDKNQYL